MAARIFMLGSVILKISSHSLITAIEESVSILALGAQIVSYSLMLMGRIGGATQVISLIVSFA